LFRSITVTLDQIAIAANGKTSWEMKERNIEKNRRSPKNKKAVGFEPEVVPV
jgi:hypothetical protein